MESCPERVSARRGWARGACAAQRREEAREVEQETGCQDEHDRSRMQRLEEGGMLCAVHHRLLHIEDVLISLGHDRRPCPETCVISRADCDDERWLRSARSVMDVCP